MEPWCDLTLDGLYGKMPSLQSITVIGSGFPEEDESSGSCDWADWLRPDCQRRRTIRSRQSQQSHCSHFGSRDPRNLRWNREDGYTRWFSQRSSRPDGCSGRHHPIGKRKQWFPGYDHTER